MDKEARTAVYRMMGYMAAAAGDLLANEERLARTRGRATGDLPWDRWSERARMAGVSPKLAHLGATLMRRFFESSWDYPLGAACGFEDDGDGLVALALMKPEIAERRWERLLETDGLRGEWTPDGTWCAWNDAESSRALLELFEPNA